MDEKVTQIKSDDDEIDVGPFIQYLQTEQGHEIASRVLTIFDDVKKTALEHTTRNTSSERWIQAGIILSVVVASSVLAHFDKFDSSMGILFGTLVGYLFGKK